jgi:hypothetical protein
LATALWFGWGFVCALLTRVAFAALFRKRLGAFDCLAAYGMWFVLFSIGVAITELSGFQMYGFDSNSPQAVGYWVMFYSPLGLPLLVGAPAVLLLDGARSILAWRRLGRARPARRTPGRD